MDIQLVALYVWQGKAYVPAQGRIEFGGPFVDIEPVLEVDLVNHDIVRAIKTILKIGHPIIPTPSREELKVRRDPILALTRAGNWNELYRNGANYTIEWIPKGIKLLITQQGTRDGWEFDSAKNREFALNTTLDNIVDVIMADIETRPYLKLRPDARKQDRKTM
jgi:hypothetical protein